MALDPVTNFGKVTVSGGYTAAALLVTLNGGGAARLPDPAVSGAFNLTWWNSTDYPDPSDDPLREIVRVTAIAGEVLTVTRAQEGTLATAKNTAGKTYQMVLAPTKKTIDDIGTSFLPTGTALLLDQTVPQTVQNGMPVFLNGVSASEVQTTTLRATQALAQNDQGFLLCTDVGNAGSYLSGIYSAAADVLSFLAAASFDWHLDYTGLTAERTLTVPNNSGTIALTSDLSAYQPLDADLTAIAGLSFTSMAFLKKTALNTWALDTNTYLTSEADTLATVTGRGATTATACSITGNSQPHLTLGTVNLGAGYTGTLRLNDGQTAANYVLINTAKLSTSFYTAQYPDAPAGTHTHIFGQVSSNQLAYGGTAPDLTSSKNFTVNAATPSFQIGSAGTTGNLILAARNGALNYTWTLVGSAAALASYIWTLPTANPGATQLITCTNAGQLGYQTGTAFTLAVFTGTNVLGNIAAVGSTGNYLRANSAAVPSWSILTLPNTATAFKLAAYTATNVMTELAAVGGTGQILLGATGAIPAWSNDLVLAGKATTYNNVVTEGYGLPAIVDRVGLTGQTADIGATNLTNAGTAGEYRISYCLLDTTADVTAGIVTLTFAWTDAAGATTKTDTINLAALGRSQGVFYLQLASGNVTYATTHTGIFGTAAYALYFICERVN